jgi:hypothetical protein
MLATAFISQIQQRFSHEKRARVFGPLMSKKRIPLPSVLSAQSAVEPLQEDFLPLITRITLILKKRILLPSVLSA